MNLYNVIRILDSYSVLINYGRNDGAKVGQNVQIIEVGPTVKDTNSGLDLGSFDYVKAELQITEVFDRFSLCKKQEEVVIPTFVNPLAPNTKIMTEKKLNVNEEQIQALERPVNNTINLGDSVKIL